MSATCCGEPAARSTVWPCVSGCGSIETKPPKGASEEAECSLDKPGSNSTAKTAIDATAPNDILDQRWTCGSIIRLILRPRGWIVRAKPKAAISLAERLRLAVTCNRAWQYVSSVVRFRQSSKSSQQSSRIWRSTRLSKWTNGLNHQRIPRRLWSEFIHRSARRW